MLNLQVLKSFQKGMYFYYSQNHAVGMCGHNQKSSDCFERKKILAKVSCLKKFQGRKIQTQTNRLIILVT